MKQEKGFCCSKRLLVPPSPAFLFPQHEAKLFGGSHRFCCLCQIVFKVSLTECFRRSVQALNSAEIIVQLLLIGFSVNKAFIDWKIWTHANQCLRSVRFVELKLILWVEKKMSELIVDENMTSSEAHLFIFLSVSTVVFYNKGHFTILALVSQS